MIFILFSSNSLVIQWRFVNRVQKQMNAFLEVFTCNNTVTTWGQRYHRLRVVEALLD